MYPPPPIKQGYKNSTDKRPVHQNTFSNIKYGGIVKIGNYLKRDNALNEPFNKHI